MKVGYKVVLVHVRQIDIPVAPYINSTGYVDDISQERREESHHLLRAFAEALNKQKVSLIFSQVVCKY